MAERRRPAVKATLLDARNLVSARSTDMQPWPAGQDILYWDLADAAFKAGTVLVEVEVSWDSGLSWSTVCRTAYDWDAERLDGGPHGQFVGPFKFGSEANPNGVIINPTHYRLSIRPLRGSPVVGLRVG